MGIKDILTGGFLKGYKTYITSVVGIITAISYYLYGDMDIQEVIQTVMPLIGIVFLRKGLKEDTAKRK